MQTAVTTLQEGCKRHVLVIVLVLLAITEIASLAVGTRSTGVDETTSRPLLKISEIRGPMIDDQAAMIVVDNGGAIVSTGCVSLPLQLWVFLLVAYVALLVFNFSYTFRQAVRPQWGWEMLYTVLVVIGWYAWDGCREYVWFPFAAVKLGLIVFVGYAYLVEQRVKGMAQIKEA